MYGPDLVEGRCFEIVAEGLQEALAEQAHRTGLADLAAFEPGRLRQVIGSPAGEIVALARQVKADLIVAGAEESGILHHIVLGSTAAGVVRHAPCPILVVRSEPSFPPARVEIPVDLSPLSAQAFQTGLSFLARIGAPLDEVETLFVLSPVEAGGLFHFTEEQIARFAGEELRRFMETNGPSQTPRRSRVCTGYPREEILRVLNERQVDLAILGTHGRTGFDRLLMGSVAMEVLHRAACNLLLIPPDAPVERETAPRKQSLASADWAYVSDEVPLPASRS
jgi:nucleotide-binding universal stress UspA family protein